MRHMVIRYEAKPDRIAENRQLIEAVFSELAEAKPDNFRYLVLELEGGGFVHVVEAPDDPAANPITRLPAFRTFSGTSAERHQAPAETRKGRVVGSYRAFGSGV